MSGLRRDSSYRPDIDGLRAIAVLSVLAYHYSAPFSRPLLPGGFTGVDVFFVISGFLITSKLAEEIRSGTFSVLGFYDRRIRRILPALLVMLAVTLLAGKFLLIPGDYTAMAASTAAAAFGVSNFFFLSNTGYFDRAADLMPLLHTWSLAVEEQFYLVWPPLLFLIAAGRKRHDVAAVVLSLAIIGFGASLFWLDADRKAAFYMALPRAWELALGGALVFLPPLRRAASEVAIAVGMALIITGFAVASPAKFPGAMALYPCIGAALVIWPRRQPIRAAICLGWLAPIGLISYSLYLWHWPVWVLFRVYVGGGQPRPGEAVLLAAISVVLAALSWRFIEQPFRAKRWPAEKSVAAGLAACMALSCAGIYVVSAEGLPRRMSDKFLDMRSLEVMWHWPCPVVRASNEIIPSCVFGGSWAEPGEKALLWGDSIAQSVAPLVETQAKRAAVPTLLYDTCPAILDSKVRRRDLPGTDYHEVCDVYRRQVIGFLGKHPEVKTVILASAWPGIVNVLEGRPEDVVSIFANAIDDTVRQISAPGRKIVVLAAYPRWRQALRPCVSYDIGLLRRPCADDDQRFPGASDYSVSVLRGIAAGRHDFELIVPSETLCNAQQRCIDQINGEPLYRDAVHFRRNLSEDTKARLAALLGFDRLFGRQARTN